jgi:hypothetical protein
LTLYYVTNIEPEVVKIKVELTNYSF